MGRYFLFVLVTAGVLSCSKDRERNTFLVSARKMISITTSDWNNTEPQLNGKTGYRYTKSPENLSTVIKAEVTLPAIDDSNRTAKGSVLLNIAPDNRVFHASFDTEPFAKVAAYAMLLNYNRESLETVSGVSGSIGEVIENGRGGNTTVDAVLSKVSSGQEADQLGVTYHTAQGKFTMVVFKQPDGRYVFSYRGSR